LVNKNIGEIQTDMSISIKYNVVAGRQGGEREINECYSKMKQNKNPELGNVTWRPEKGHLASEVGVASEMTCDMYGKSFALLFL
jgi:hypothetical protein